LGVVLLESGLNYTKLDLYVAFSNSMKYLSPVYVTRSLTCGHEDVYFYFIVMIFIIISIIFISTLLFSFTKSKSSNASHCHDNQQSSRWHIWQINGPIWLKFQVIRYQSIALETVYNFSFEYKSIGWKLWPQTNENSVRDHALTWLFPFKFTAERTLGSSWTQKTFDRSL
jgi:hypothetical protein